MRTYSSQLPLGATQGAMLMPPPWTLARTQTAIRRHKHAAVACFIALLFALTACHRKPDTTSTPESTPTTQPFIPTDPALKPTETLAAKAACITPACHATFRTAAHIHGPIAANSCQSCHQNDQGGHKFPLLRPGNLLCTFCHVVADTKPYQHKALQPTAVASPGTAVPGLTPAPNSAGSTPDKIPPTGGCLVCHSPHISKAKFLLVTDKVDTLCAKCHTLPLKAHAHQPFAAGQCTVCHQPHQSDFKSLLRNGDGPDHCFSCHPEKKTAMNQSPFVHKAAAQSCTTCHGPHATDNGKQLKAPINDTCLNCHTKLKEQIATAKVVHGAITQQGGGCTICHDAHAANQPAELRARTDKVCLSCHEQSIKTAEGRTIQAMGPVLASKNLHGPVKTGSCAECHLPHAGDQRDLLKQFFPDSFYTTGKFDVTNYALCFSCHDQQLILRRQTTNLTDFRDGDKNLHAVHVNRDDKGRTCKSCHDSHGSDLPNHMAASVPFEGSTWSMPIRYQPSSTGGTCTPGCHDAKTYDRTKPAGTMPATGGPK